MTFNKNILAIAAAAVSFAAAGSAMAADGTITFTGAITTASCSLTGGAGASVSPGTGGQDIAVNLGTVSADSIGNAASGGVVAGTNINLNLDCGKTGTGLNMVKMKFDPAAGSGLDAKNNQLLKVTGDAEGVAIGLYDANNERLNLAASDTFNAPLVKGGTEEAPIYTAALNLRAGYVANGAPIKAGKAIGTLPFTLTYE
ncbi:type 1 fimbrial protein [Burkholderia ambifaria]|jgi:type 1 fimbria pilin|uniref:fimbrial protein n=1 Tax=Burkholderia ambifaria TaxID=152480 RepID=UPI001B8F95BD|nr:fimbrial protein [Burkholderia ambifaria]MBR8062423.1 type 1 fimbrial protein [Burkholderia ambifaria]